MTIKKTEIESEGDRYREASKENCAIGLEDKLSFIHTQFRGDFCFVKLYIVVLVLLLMVLHTMYRVTFEEIKMFLKLYFGPRYFA